MAFQPSRFPHSVDNSDSLLCSFPLVNLLVHISLPVRMICWASSSRYNLVDTTFYWLYKLKEEQLLQHIILGIIKKLNWVKLHPVKLYKTMRLDNAHLAGLNVIDYTKGYNKCYGPSKCALLNWKLIIPNKLQ